MKSVIIIGSFKKTSKGSFGGLYFACSTLTSRLIKHNIKVIELDTTIDSIDDISVLKRFPSLVLRSLRFLFDLAWNFKTKTVFIFVSAGNSYIDKIPVVILSKLLNKKLVIFPRSGHLLNDYEKPVYKRVINWTFRSVDYIICQSDFWKSFFNSINVPEKKTIVVENWIEDSKIERSKDIPFKSDLSVREVNIIYLSRIEEKKGILDIIDVANLLKKQDGFIYKFHVYGEGSYLSSFLNLIDKNDLGEIIEYKGWLNHTNLLFTINNYDLAIFSSKIEGYPNALLDYILAKVPIISTNIDTVYAVGGENMVYYSPGNVIELHDAIIFASINYSKLVNNSILLYKRKVDKNSIEKSLPVLLNLIK